MTDLEPLTPRQAISLYLDARQDEPSEMTVDGQKYRLRAFAQWCEGTGIENLNELSGRDMYQYRVWRRDGGYQDGEELKTVTLRGDMATIRAFLRFCAQIDAVPEELFSQVPLPTTGAGGDVSDSTLDPDRAISIINYLEKYQYASLNHLVLLVLWHTGCRVGELRGLDLEDCDLDGDRPNASGPAVHFVHRPDQGTPLKNKEKGERWNTISPFVAGVIEDWIDGPRPDTTDKDGRRPLVTSKQGRRSRTNLRSTIYRVT